MKLRLTTPEQKRIFDAATAGEFEAKIALFRIMQRAGIEPKNCHTCDFMREGIPCKKRAPSANWQPRDCIQVPLPELPAEASDGISVTVRLIGSICEYWRLVDKALVAAAKDGTGTQKSELVEALQRYDLEHKVCGTCSRKAANCRHRSHALAKCEDISWLLGNPYKYEWYLIEVHE